MDISLSKLPWYAQIGAFVVVSGLAVFGFWKFYVSEMQADIDARQTRLTALKADISKGVATARRLPQFQSEVAELERRLENLRAVLPEQKDVADILRRVQGLATQSSLTIQRFTPQEPKQEAMYASLPFKLRAEGTFHILVCSSTASASSRGSSTLERSSSSRVSRKTQVRHHRRGARGHDVSCCRKTRRAGGRVNVPKQPSAK
jgi:Tfp pilus assembly protein PilO